MQDTYFASICSLNFLSSFSGLKTFRSCKKKKILLKYNSKKSLNAQCQNGEIQV